MSFASLAHHGKRLQLTSHQLKHMAFLMGLPLTGTKSELESTINSSLSRQASCGKQRVVSVDMGIRNLAYSVVETSQSSSKPLRVTTWRRTDLLGTDPTEPKTEVAGEVASTPRKVVRTRNLDPFAKAAFTPPLLAKTAFELCQELLTYKPTIVLIEQQRFRSGGGSAIQEWTVRVNLLESMLWACLHTIKQRSRDRADASPTVYGVAPARVASFWTAASDLSLRATEGFRPNGTEGSSYFRSDSARKRPRKKVEKKDKVNIVRSWLAGEDKDVSLDFEGEAVRVAGAFQAKTSRRKRDVVAEDKALGKLDDLADCLLQAVAWTRWEENKRVIGEMLEAEHIAQRRL